jgi:NADPH2:quinone reductase
MKAVQISRFGGPEVLEVVDIPVPSPAPGQVLVRVRAAGINFADTLMRRNRYAVTPDLPAILGAEIAGTVEMIGTGVLGIEVGMRVASPLIVGGQHVGGYAQYVVLDADQLVPLPDSLSFEVATALMVQGLTALYLTRQISPRGKTILINAAAGGVGSLLVQLAKRAGAKRVIAAAGRDEKLDLARSLGADLCVNYTRSGWVELARSASGGGPDIIYESAGGDVTKASLEALAPLGELVVYGALNIQEFQIGVPELLGLIFKNQSVTGFALAPLLTLDSAKAALTELFELTVRGELKVTIGGTYALHHAAEAHGALEERRTTGKLVLMP